MRFQPAPEPPASELDAKIAALEAQNAEIKELKEMVRVLALQQSQTTSFLQAGL